MEQVTIKLYKNTINSSGLIAENAVFNDSVSLVREKDSDEVFYRDSIDGKFTFTGTIYTAIATNSTLEDKFYLVLYDGATAICTGEFTKLDCSFDDDNGICVVNSLGKYDRYSKILEGMNNKYNLVSLAPSANRVRIKKRAILQIYIAGDSKITNVLGNMSYEVSANPTTDYSTLVNTYHFSRIREYQYQKVPEGTTGVYVTEENGQNVVHQVDISGYYYYTSHPSTWVWEWWREDHEFLLQWQQDDQTVYDAFIYKPLGNDQFANVTKSPDAPWNFGSGGGVGANVRMYDRQADQTPLSTYLCDLPYRVSREIYARVISDNDTGGSSHRLPTEDICENNMNYRYWYDPNTSGVNSHLKSSHEFQTDPTPYGKNEDGDYYVKPAPTVATNNIIPIGWSMWGGESYWYESYIDTSLENYDANFDLMDAYTIQESIELIAKQIDPTIDSVTSTIIGSSAYASLIPYPANTNIYITPISNIKKTYYSTAAQRGDISLADLLGMLEKCFKIYWYIDDNKVMHLEHLYYFLNGMSYSTPTNTDICDITSIKTPMANLPWSYGTNKYSFDTSDLKKRYEFNWGGESTEQFNGYPLEVKNNFCENASTDPITVDNFISDIDFVIGSPNTLNDDLYALLMVSNNTIPKKTRIQNYQIKSGTTEFRMQNGEASFFYTANLNKNLHLYDIDGDSVYANGIQLTAIQSTKRLKRQEEIVFPVEWSKAFRNYVTTGYGRCQIEHIEINMESKMATAKVIIP